MPAYRWAWYIEGVDPEVGNSFLDDRSEAGLAERVVARSAPPTRVIAWGGEEGMRAQVLARRFARAGCR